MVTAKASTRIANFHFMILSLLYSDGTLTWRRNRPEQCLFLFSVTRTAQDVELAIGLRFSLAGHGKLPLSMRKMNLERLLRGRPDGIFVNPFEVGAIGPDLFHAACSMGLEGLVSKRSDRPYHGGRSKDWIKVKNRAHPAMERVMETFR